MNYFLSWCRPLLVSFLFHAVTSLHPPSFHRNDFSTCSTHFFILGQAPSKMWCFVLVLSPLAHTLRTRMRIWTTARTRVVVYTCVRCMQMASFAVCSRGGPGSTVDMYGCSKTIARCPCTPPSTLVTFVGEKNSGEACSGKEIAG